ncbi:hypothetical protein OAO87_03355 [bacterium]|nr:hypothetical protein [bacterium]
MRPDVRDRTLVDAVADGRDERPDGLHPRRLGQQGAFLDDVGTAAEFNKPVRTAASPDGTYLFVVDFSNHRIRQIMIATGVVTTLAGGTQGFLDATGTAAQFNKPHGIESSLDGTALFVADMENHRIRSIVVSTGVVTTLAGSNRDYLDGTGTACKFNFPRGLALSRVQRRHNPLRGGFQ